MKNFCLYNGKKIAKLETWDIASIELSSDYASVIIQAESKRNKSEYTLDIIPLISNQYKNGIDPYSSTIVSELTGVSDWVLDSDNNQIKYNIPDDPTVPDPTSEYHYQRVGGWATLCNRTYYVKNLDSLKPDAMSCLSESGKKASYQYTTVDSGQIVIDFKDENGQRNIAIYFAHVNPNYDPNAESDDGEKSIPLETVTQQVISNAESGDSSAQQVIISTFNNITDGLLNYDYSEFFEANKQPK